MREKPRHILAWVGSALLALIFLVFGGSKLMGQQMQIDNFEAWGYPTGFVYVIGAIELACAIAILIPKARFYAATTLQLTMIGAMVTHIAAAEYAMLALNLAIIVIAGLLAWNSKPAWVAARMPEASNTD